MFFALCYNSIPFLTFRVRISASYICPHSLQVEHCQRAQLQLFLFAKKTLREVVTGVEKSVENTGFLHLFPNKGGLLVTMQIHGTKLAFISCHLTAHEGVKHCEARNQSIREILGGVRAGDKTFDVAEQYHHVFWIGDMNYRTTIDPAVPTVIKKNAHSYELPLTKYQTVKELGTAQDSPKGDMDGAAGAGTTDAPTGAVSVDQVDTGLQKFSMVRQVYIFNYHITDGNVCNLLLSAFPFCR